MYDDTPLQVPFNVPIGDGGLYQRTKCEILALQHRKQELAWALHAHDLERPVAPDIPFDGAGYPSLEHDPMHGFPLQHPGHMAVDLAAVQPSEIQRCSGYRDQPLYLQSLHRTNSAPLGYPKAPPAPFGAEYSASATQQQHRWAQHPVDRLVAAEVQDSPVRAARSLQDQDNEKHRARLSLPGPNNA